MLTRFPQGGILPIDAWRQRHRAVLLLLWGHVPAVAFYGLARGYAPLHLAMEVALIALLALLAGIPRLAVRHRSLAASIGLLTCSAVLVHLSQGLIEMHFHYFVMIVVVALYQDWLPFIAGCTYVLLHHGIAGAIDPRSVFNHPAAIEHPWLWSGIHALFIGAISSVCIVSWRLNEQHLLAAGFSERRMNDEILLVERLSEVGGLLGKDLDLEHVVQATVDAATGLTSAELGVFVFAASGGDTSCGDLRWVGSPGLPGSRQADRRVLSSPAWSSALLHGDVERRDRGAQASDWGLEHLGPDLRMVGAAGGSWLTVPVLLGGQVRGALLLVHTDPEHFSTTAQRAARGVAAHAAAAVENARLYAGQREAAAILQRSLVPDRVPPVAGYASSCRYLPGGEACEIGGDWYDVFTTPDAMVTVVIGDVVGHGLAAAAVMGQLRNGLRAYALEGYAPASLLEHLNSLACSLDRGYVATVLVLSLNPATGEILMANAGHLVPFIRDRGVAKPAVAGAPGPPLGVVAHASYEHSSYAMGPGSSLILYTDGLVEDRQTPLDAGMERVRKAVESGPDDAEQMCDHLVKDRVGVGALTDDCALLILRRDPVATSSPSDEVAPRIEGASMGKG